MGYLMSRMFWECRAILDSSGWVIDEVLLIGFVRIDAWMRKNLLDILRVGSYCGFIRFE
ncbi:unnamed protein product [Rhodiola kirilowii]